MTKMEEYSHIFEFLQNSFRLNPATTGEIFTVLFRLVLKETERINFYVNFGRGFSFLFFVISFWYYFYKPLETVIQNLRNLLRLNSDSLLHNTIGNAGKNLLSIVRATVVLPSDHYSPVAQLIFERFTLQHLCAEVNCTVGDLEFYCSPDECTVMRTYTDSLTCVSHKRPQSVCLIVSIVMFKILYISYKLNFFIMLHYCFSYICLLLPLFC